jgi:ABC-type iron transport system FetAB ATPase subunit
MAGLRLQGMCSGLLAPVDLGIEAGELAFVYGPSGAGKSLLLRAIADLDPNDGEAYVNGTARRALRPTQWRRQVGLLPAESGWWAETVGEHFPAASAAPPTAGPAAELLQQLGFGPDALDWTIARLSTGERQRLALARLLAHGPEVLLLDEATANLDPGNCRLVEEAVDAYRDRHRAAVLWVSHDADQRRRLGGRAFVIEDGRLRPESRP